MARTGTRAALLRVCLQDLRAGKQAQVERLPGIAQAAEDAHLRALLERAAEQAGEQHGRLDALGDVGAGPDNLWMRGILDDAERDTRSHQPGPLLDIALVGAIRKAKAAEIVSTETALALAASEAPEMLAALRSNHEAEIAMDHRLRARLAALAGA